MTAAVPAAVTEPVDPSEVRSRVTAVLDRFLAAKECSATTQSLPPEVPTALRDFLRAGGKRLRPLLCVLGWHAAAGHGERSQVLQVAASLELFHAFALIHDDVMDSSDERRGQPTVHRRIAALHSSGRADAQAAQLGRSAAILIGDLALTWCDELLHTAGLTDTQRTAVLPLVDTMRTEVMYGQYLDVLSTGSPSADLERSWAIIRYKTAKYTCERPLQIGAALAGANRTALDALSAFALPLGEAFQLRDDLLGVFGKPAQTGKPVLDDLREGKHTVLIALALQAAGPAQARLLHTLYGNPRLDDDTASTLRTVLKATGADQTVEDMIRTRHAQALAELARAKLPPDVHAQLRELAEQATWRTS